MSFVSPSLVLRQDEDYDHVTEEAKSACRMTKDETTKD
jgi:hypothetical protein